MIRINLVNGKKISASTAPSGEEILSNAEAKEVQKQGLLRLFVILILPLLLYLYEFQNLPELRARVQSKRNLLNSLTQKNAQAKTAVEEIKKFKIDQAQLQKQITTLESLRKERLREVKILDNLQKDTHEKVWITKVSVDARRLTISGVTLGDLELSAFMDVLSRSIFLTRVNLVRSADLPFSGGVQTKSFEIVCELENLSPDSSLRGSR